MTDWLRSITILAIAFVGVIVVTLGLATAIVPRPAAGGPVADASTEPGASGAATVEPEPSGGIPGLGGLLTVTGDREGTFRVTRESLSGTYALVGNDGRIAFEGQPGEVVQLSYEGWEFFPDPGDCTISTGNLDGAIGIGFAELACTGIADVRGNGVVSITGTLGLPLDRLVGRELPPTGGSITVGEETWTFESAFLYAWQQPIVAGNEDWNLQLFDEVQVRALSFLYDVETHRLSVAGVMGPDGEADVPEDACSLQRTDLGRPNPRTTTIELAISCSGVEVPGLGTVPIRGSVVVDELEWPE